MAGKLPRPAEFCAVKDCRGLDEERDGYRWLGAPLAEDVVKRRYAYRPLVHLLSKSDAQRQQSAHEATQAIESQRMQKAEHRQAAAAHFCGFWADESEDGVGDQQKVYVGDYVLVTDESSRSSYSLGQVVELYQDPAGNRWMRLCWFYTCYNQETSMQFNKKKTKKGGDDEEEEESDSEEGSESEKEEEEEAEIGADGQPVFRMAVEHFDRRQVFRARDTDAYPCDQPIGALIRKVTVTYVRSSEQPPSPEEAEYWWTFEFDRRFFTFEVTAAEAALAKARFLRLRPKNAPLSLRGMDLYVGAGGLGYLDFVSLLKDKRTGRIRPDPSGVQLRTDWALDYEEDMAATFKANNLHSHVFTSGTDEHLEMCKAVKELVTDDLKMECSGQPPKPWDGSGPLARCDDDLLVAAPRSVVLEQRRLRPRGRRPAAAAAAASLADLEGREEDQEMEAAEASGAAQAEAGEEEEEEEEEAPPAKKARGAKGKAVATNGKGKAAAGQRKGKTAAAAKGGKAAAKKKNVLSDVEKAALEEEEAAAISEEDCLPYRGTVGKVLSIKRVRLAERAPRVAGAGISGGAVRRFIKPEERWLEFEVEMEGQADSVWLHRKQLKGCDALLRAFVRRLRERQCIPFPGEVDFICGGPPCQGISGNNRHALLEDIFNCPRNRQLPVFTAYIRWLRPKYVLMENVTDILKKEDGAYIKYAMGSMLDMRYQVRVGQLAAGNFGVPQGRWRVFMFAAAPGQQLPAIPKPTHNCVKFQHAMSKNAQRIVSGFTSEEDCFAAYSQVLLGDILSDLPCVDNFELQDRQRYAGPPERLTQAWLRRKPAPWMTPLVDRMAYQDEYQRAAHDELVERLIKEAEVHGLRGLGKEALANTKNPLRYQKEKNGEAKKRKDDHSAGNHAFESIDACFRHIQDPKIQAVMWLQAEASRAGYTFTEGEKFLARLKAYKEEGAALRADPEATLCDHRPLFLNLDDNRRMELIPSRAPGEGDVNFRNLPGSVNNEDGRCCYGHSHAAIVNGKSTCTGGGVYEDVERKKKGTHKEYRHDHFEKEGWRGGALQGCKAYTRLMPSGDPEVPRWCVTYKKGKSAGRHGCYGRISLHEIITTVVGRAEPHNLRLGHPEQKRVMTIRENARVQGFPDYHVLLARPPNAAKPKRFIRSAFYTQRYQQMGNAVCPQVASALGRCLALAALHETPQGAMLLSVPDPEYDEMAAAWEELVAEDPTLNLAFYAEEYFADKKPELLPNLVAHLGEGQVAAVQTNRRSSGSESDSEEEEEEERLPACKQRGGSGGGRAPAAQQQQQQQQAASSDEDEEMEEEKEERSEGEDVEPLVAADGGSGPEEEEDAEFEDAFSEEEA
ncbi:DNA (cytosine-5)-methyltransferase CMT1 isoform A [Chlorella sorokiniana]|uniref:DNA (cytosine-5-)-methyltransferase n=1 Tax=Chlorella sorokiniana TaxID=3076 RepID=A0A2P6TJM4_CHLSO|nr:DNA (cytosine-5)-methyltransferase CMT1 isoform A [Chlorella sorokiniana]|eukprot:PRW44284.1 DNA (cytosine-5)-methyltransferase CMT1 isoform A [Chlorella sorokiniana]